MWKHIFFSVLLLSLLSSLICRGSPWRSWNTSCSTPSVTTWPWRTSRTSSSMRKKAWRRTPGTVRQSLREVSENPWAGFTHRHLDTRVRHRQALCAIQVGKLKVTQAVRKNFEASHQALQPTGSEHTCWFIDLRCCGDWCQLVSCSAVAGMKYTWLHSAHPAIQDLWTSEQERVLGLSLADQ